MTKRGVKKSDVKSNKKKVSKRGRVGEGRPPKYTDLETFQRKIDEYFESCWVDKVTEVMDKEGNCTMSTVRYQNRPYTIMGLVLALGLTSRKSLLDYQGREEFCNAVKKAKTKVEMCVEEYLFNAKNAAGPIFWLKNNAETKYQDKQEFEHTGAEGGPIEFSRLDRANRLAAIANAALKRKQGADNGTSCD